MRIAAWSRVLHRQPSLLMHSSMPMEFWLVMASTEVLNLLIDSESFSILPSSLTRR